MWRGGAHGEPETLASCYQRSLEVASAHDARTIAFPSISTGIYGYPVELAAGVAVESAYRFVNRQTDLEEIAFCCFSSNDLAVYRRVLSRYAAEVRR